MDFEHDDLSTPVNNKTKALLTVDLKDCLRDASVSDTGGQSNTENGYINTSIDTGTGWIWSNRRRWCNDGFFNALPSYMQDLVKPVDKLTDFASTITTTSDKVFLLSEVEMCGAAYGSSSGEGTQYELYEGGYSNWCKLPYWTSNADSCAYWLRSPSKNTANYFCSIYYDADVSENAQTSTLGFAPAFCI